MWGPRGAPSVLEPREPSLVYVHTVDTNDTEALHINMFKKRLLKLGIINVVRGGVYVEVEYSTFAMHQLQMRVYEKRHLDADMAA